MPQQQQYTQLKNSSNNKSTVKSIAFWLSVWKRWCLEKGIAKEIKITSQSSLTLCFSNSVSKLKKTWSHLTNNNSIPLKVIQTDVKISLCITVLIVVLVECTGLNKLFLHLMHGFASA